MKIRFYGARSAKRDACAEIDRLNDYIVALRNSWRAEVKQLSRELVAVRYELSDTRLRRDDARAGREDAEADRDRAREIAVAMEQENARLTELTESLQADEKRMRQQMSDCLTDRGEFRDDRDRARDAAVALEQQLAEIEQFAYMGGQDAETIRRRILGVFERERRALDGGEGK